MGARRIRFYAVQMNEITTIWLLATMCGILFSFALGGLAVGAYVDGRFLIVTILAGCGSLGTVIAIADRVRTIVKQNHFEDEP